MVHDRSLVVITDNTGGKVGRIFKVLGGSKKRYAEIGDLVVLSVQVAEPRKMVKKKEVLHAVVVRQRKPFRRKDGQYIRFDDNAVVILAKNPKDPFEPKANRIFGPIPREIVDLGYQKIGSLAPEVV
jgi:large subunit ribosomal protein L14